MGDYQRYEGEGSCVGCKPGQSSPMGSATCDICAKGYFRPHASSSAAECSKCADILGITCGINTTVNTFNMTEGYWRMSPGAVTTYACEYGATTGLSSCRGGANAGVDGDGYCLDRYRGPRCSHIPSLRL